MGGTIQSPTSEFHAPKRIKIGEEKEVKYTKDVV
jgi:hypothetical protein